jgi:hypothetical protein
VYEIVYRKSKACAQFQIASLLSCFYLVAIAHITLFVRACKRSNAYGGGCWVVAGSGLDGVEDGGEGGGVVLTLKDQNVLEQDEVGQSPFALERTQCMKSLQMF